MARGEHGAADGLALAAAPCFALMGLATALSGDARMAAICGTGPAWLTGMAPMYLLMSAFHAGPWVRRARGRRGMR